MTLVGWVGGHHYSHVLLPEGRGTRGGAGQRTVSASPNHSQESRKEPNIEPSDVIASIGVALILIAFILNLAGIMDRFTRSYLLLNLIGASLTLLASAIIQFDPFVVLEAVWDLAALIGLLRQRSQPEAA